MGNKPSYNPDGTRRMCWESPLREGGGGAPAANARNKTKTSRLGGPGVARKQLFPENHQEEEANVAPNQRRERKRSAAPLPPQPAKRSKTTAKTSAKPKNSLESSNNNQTTKSSKKEQPSKLVQENNVNEKQKETGNVEDDGDCTSEENQRRNQPLDDETGGNGSPQPKRITLRRGPLPSRNTLVETTSRMNEKRNKKSASNTENKRSGGNKRENSSRKDKQVSKKPQKTATLKEKTSRRRSLSSGHTQKKKKRKTQHTKTDEQQQQAFQMLKSRLADNPGEFLAELPECIRDMFGRIGFGKWGCSKFQPALCVSPVHIPEGPVREAWLHEFQKYETKNKTDGTTKQTMTEKPQSQPVERIFPIILFWYGCGANSWYRGVGEDGGKARSFAVVPFWHFIPFGEAPAFLLDYAKDAQDREREGGKLSKDDQRKLVEMREMMNDFKQHGIANSGDRLQLLDVV